MTTLDELVATPGAYVRWQAGQERRSGPGRFGPLPANDRHMVTCQLCEQPIKVGQSPSLLVVGAENEDDQKKLDAGRWFAATAAVVHEACAWAPVVEPVPTGADLIAAERHRQVEVEGFTVEHDAEHRSGGLGDAAWCYLTNLRELPDQQSPSGWTAATTQAWPWDREAFRPTPGNPIRQLVKAGALIAAEIDRLLAAGDPS